MRGTCKKLVTDINRGEKLDVKLPEYISLLKKNFNLYATVKMCMNYYTMKEMLFENEDKTAAYRAVFDEVTGLIKRHILEKNAVCDEALLKIKELRKSIENKMKCLTAYSDGFETYEYILNRTEAHVLGTEKEIDVEQLSAKLFSYVFSDNDTVMVNSKLKLVISQLPIRMTKMKFFDVLSRTLMIYSGSEKSSAREFADMLLGAALILKPEGFESEYPELYAFYEELKAYDYKALNADVFNDINGRLHENAEKISEEVSVYMLLAEIVNDVFAILLTIDGSRENNLKESAFCSALTILSECVSTDNPDDLPESLFAKFVDIEGVQETVYEYIMILFAAYDDILSGNAAVIEELSLDRKFEELSLTDKLLSTSLFIDIEEKPKELYEACDNEFIDELKEELVGKLSALFKGQQKLVMRSIMCKLLSVMPVFMNSREEVREYFDYTLGNCRDASELTACSRISDDIMEDE